MGIAAQGREGSLRYLIACFEYGDRGTPACQNAMQARAREGASLIHLETFV